jgi:pyruvate/2-oxoglutarate dehydrogenase complex dihydrolipoamide dehydrogenase (E3) component
VEITADDGSVQTLLTTRSIVIATGARPFVPPLPGLDEVGYLTSDTLWGLRELPKRLVVLGGGPDRLRAGAELCAPGLAGHAGRDGAAHHGARGRGGVGLAQRALRPTACRAHRPQGAALRKRAATKCSWCRPGRRERIEFDALLCAVGRSARLRGFGLEDLGIPTRTVPTNEYLQTIYPNILRRGRRGRAVTSSPTPRRTRPGTRRSMRCSGASRSSRPTTRVIPWATFIDPEVARVGLNEQDAKAQGVAYEVTRYGIDDLDRAIADSEAHGFVKVLTVPGKDRILGVTIVGVHAGDLLAEYVLAMKHGLG